MLLVEKMAMIRQREANVFSKNLRKLSEVTPVDGINHNHGTQMEIIRTYNAFTVGMSSKKSNAIFL